MRDIREIETDLAYAEQQVSRWRQSVVDLKIERANALIFFDEGQILINKVTNAKAVVEESGWHLSERGDTLSLLVRRIKKNGEPYKDQGYIHYWDVENWLCQ